MFTASGRRQGDFSTTNHVSPNSPTSFRVVYHMVGATGLTLVDSEVSTSRNLVLYVEIRVVPPSSFLPFPVTETFYCQRITLSPYLSPTSYKNPDNDVVRNLKTSDSPTIV